MIIRNSTLQTTRRTLPLRPISTPVRLAPAGQIDSFQPASRALSVSQSAQTAAVAPTSGSSKGGFFSRLWGGLKKVGAGILGQAGQWLSANVGKYIGSDMVGSLLNRAATGFQGILASWQQKLGN
jgi:hypothetical protein